MRYLIPTLAIALALVGCGGSPAPQAAAPSALRQARERCIDAVAEGADFRWAKPCTKATALERR